MVYMIEDVVPDYPTHRHANNMLHYVSHYNKIVDVVADHFKGGISFWYTGNSGSMIMGMLFTKLSNDIRNRSILNLVRKEGEKHHEMDFKDDDEFYQNQQGNVHIFVDDFIVTGKTLLHVLLHANKLVPKFNNFDVLLAPTLDGCIYITLLVPPHAAQDVVLPLFDSRHRILLLNNIEDNDEGIV